MDGIKQRGVRYKTPSVLTAMVRCCRKIRALPDMMIEKALLNKYGEAELAPLDNSLEVFAREQVKRLLYIKFREKGKFFLIYAFSCVKMIQHS